MDGVGIVLGVGLLLSILAMMGVASLRPMRAARIHAQGWRAALDQLASDRRASHIAYGYTDANPTSTSSSGLMGRHASLNFTNVFIEVEQETVSGRHGHIHHLSTVVAHLPSGLDLGLTVQRGLSLPHAPSTANGGPANWLSALAQPFDPRGIPTGDWELDRRFHFWAREPKRLRALMNSDVRRGLLGAAGTVDVSVTDTEVRFEHRGVIHPELALWMIHDAAWLARALVEAARHVPPSAWALHYRPVFEHAARALGMRYTLAPPMLGGMLGGVAVQCALIPGRVEDPPGLRLYAAFPRPLGLGLHLRPAQDGGLGLLRARDVELGDRLLDDKLDVHGDHPAAIQALFDAEARALLHHLRDRGRIYVDDAGIRLESFGSADPRDLLPSLERTCALARLLTHRRAGLAAAQ